MSVFPLPLPYILPSFLLPFFIHIFVLPFLFFHSPPIYFLPYFLLSSSVSVYSSILLSLILHLSLFLSCFHIFSLLLCLYTDSSLFPFFPFLFPYSLPSSLPFLPPFIPPYFHLLLMFISYYLFFPFFSPFSYLTFSPTYILPYFMFSFFLSSIHPQSPPPFPAFIFSSFFPFFHHDSLCFMFLSIFSLLLIIHPQSVPPPLLWSIHPYFLLHTLSSSLPPYLHPRFIF